LAGESFTARNYHFLIDGTVNKNTKKTKRRHVVKSSTKDQAEGKFHQLKGKIKKVAGKLSDNPKLEVEGAGEEMVGKVQEKIGQVKKVWGK
jgi:uncharacterized protein YjbJ (UPF0337 family)